jgi:hypothetical protein
MMRLVRGTPVVRAVASAIAGLLLLCGLVPLAAYPLLRLDAAGYQSAIGDVARECKGDPIPARGGCWSAAPARVTISGADAQTGASFVVVDSKGQPAAREDFVTAPPAPIGVGTTLTARYWHESIAVLMLPAATKGAAPLSLPTRDNPTYRATDLPTGGALLALLGAAGLLVWGRPLLADVRAFRERRRQAADPVPQPTSTPTAGLGLKRYGIDLQTATEPEDVVLTGHRAAPANPTAAPGAGGGKGWNVRPS